MLHMVFDALLKMLVDLLPRCLASPARLPIASKVSQLFGCSDLVERALPNPRREP